MKVFGPQTKTDILSGRNVPRIAGINGDFSTKEKNVYISE